jgi:hypothetical protein
MKEAYLITLAGQGDVRVMVVDSNVWNELDRPDWNDKALELYDDSEGVLYIGYSVAKAIVWIRLNNITILDEAEGYIY